MSESHTASTRPLTSSQRSSGDDLDRQLDQAIEDSFSTSDPVSLTMPHHRPAPERSTSAMSLAAVVPFLVICGIVLALLWRRAGD